MIRWRLIVMPLIVIAVGIWATTRSAPPVQDITPGQPIDAPTKGDPIVSDPKIVKPEPVSLEKLIATDPVQFLQKSLEKYDKEIKGYTLTFDKHERVNGKLRKPETTKVHFREKPYSVHMHWTEPGDSIADKVLYVEGQNDNKLLGRGLNWRRVLGVLTRDVDGPDAKASGRFTIAQFGFKRSSQRSLASMEKAQERGTLNFRYEGIVPVEELGGQKVHKLVRTPYVPYEEDDLNELTLYFDTEHFLQVGSVLKDKKGDLLGQYFFKDVRINPEFNEKQFTREAL